jgi:hypothetical protein
MAERLQSRLDELRNELAKGQAELDKVERQRIYLRETMLRISGGIQILEELLLGGSDVHSQGSQLDSEHSSRTQTEGIHRIADAVRK